MAYYNYSHNGDDLYTPVEELNQTDTPPGISRQNTISTTVTQNLPPFGKVYSQNTISAHWNLMQNAPLSISTQNWISTPLEFNPKLPPPWDFQCSEPPWNFPWL